MNWIQTPVWTAADAAKARIIRFRKHIRRQTAGTLPVRLTAAGRYKLYVNGVLTQYGPAKGDGVKWFVDEFDLTLPAGESVIAVAVLAYPLDGEGGNHSLYRFDRPRLYVEGLGAEGWLCQVDRETVFQREEVRFAPLQIHEIAAPGTRSVGWTLPDYDEDGWTPAVPCNDLPAHLKPERLVPRDIPFMARKIRTLTLPRQDFPANGTCTFTLDAGEETCAFLRLAFDGGRGARVELLYSECYVQDHGKGNRLDAVNGHLEGYSDVYTPSGAGREVYEPYWFRTFRFLQITVTTGAEPLRLESLTLEETGYPLEVKSEVTTSDPTLTPVWDISLRTLRRCMHETYVDCPYYEQLQYIMDTRAQILYTYAISADDRLARRAMDDFARAQRPDGLLNCSYPNVNVNVIPGFSIYYILMVHDHMMYFGDRTLVQKYLPTIRRILDYFQGHLDPRGLVEKIGGVNGKTPFWSFIDWAERWMETEGMPTAGLYGPITMESLLYLYGLQTAAELCAWVGDGQEDEYRRRAAAVKTAVVANCMDEDGMLTDGPDRPELSQHAQVFGLLTGILTPAQAKRNLQRSFTDDTIAKCTVATSFYLFRALEVTGLYGETDRYWDIWRRMVENGCSTCVEGEYYPRSECHAWGALALYELPSAVLGVRPAAPGYERITIAPQPGYLTHAAGRVITPRGEISVAWRLEDGAVQTAIDCAESLRDRIVTE